MTRNINIETLTEKINGTLHGNKNYKSQEGFTGTFTTLNDAVEGDIVIRHWINGKGVEIANNKNIACIITLHPKEDCLEVAEKLKYPVIVVEKIEVANAYAIEWTVKNICPNTKRVVVSGTNGKSTTSHMTYHILKNTGAKVFTNTDARSEFNTLIDPMVPKLMVENYKQQKGLDYLVVEVSEVQGWEDYFMEGHAMMMSKAMNPDVAVVTNVAMDHIGLVNNIEEVKSETEGLVKALNHGTAILNYDDPRVKEMDKVVSQNCNITYLSMDPETLTNIEKSEKIDKLSYSDDLEAIIYDDEIFLKLEELPFQSHHFIQNTLSAIASTLALNIPLNLIKDGVRNYHPLKRRFVTLYEKPLIIDDFAHNPDGIKATVQSAFQAAYKKNLKTLWVIDAIRGSRGEVLNKLIAEALSDVVRNLQEEDTVPINLILSCSEDVVDHLNTVTDDERKVFLNVLDNDNVDYVVYDKLNDALTDTVEFSSQEDLILLIGAQGMDPAEGLLKNII
ncbi:MAG: UDP-N-acetylmuramyl peptide synthase [Methanobacteriaceae archaeon]|nr:UDP-N-acetylmuramyl peptide synthase [Methanobacteriaceae archaeon]